MKLFNLIARFRKDEDGAVTVDWVVLTAGVVAVAIGLIAVLGPSLTNIANRIETQINSVDPGSIPTGGTGTGSGTGTGTGTGG